jgi:Icc protein
MHQILGAAAVIPSSSPGATPRLVQITDSHLGERPGGRLLNLDTDHSLQAVLALVREQQPRIDALLATGDISDQGSAAAYRRFHQATRGIGAAQRWLPGNHDDFAVMRATLPGADCLQRTLLCGAWQIIMLDSTIAGASGGRLADAELDALRRCLRAQPERHALICAHHHPLAVGSAWIDPQKIENAETFWRELAAFPQVRAVLSGHVHQEFEGWRGDIRVLASPSTSVQFTPGSDDFRVDTRKPGYRWFDLRPDGAIDTGVSRVQGEFQVDLSASGY